MTVEIDRDRASALGVTAEQIENALYNAYGSRQVSTIYTPTDDYYGDPGTAAANTSATRTRSGLLYVARRSGKLVPLERGGQHAHTASAR